MFTITLLTQFTLVKMPKPPISLAQKFEESFRKFKEINAEHPKGDLPRRIEFIRDLASQILEKIQRRINSGVDKESIFPVLMQNNKKALKVTFAVRQFETKVSLLLEQIRQNRSRILGEQVQEDIDRDPVAHEIGIDSPDEAERRIEERRLEESDGDEDPDAFVDQDPPVSVNIQVPGALERSIKDGERKSVENGIQQTHQSPIVVFDDEPSTTEDAPDEDDEDDE